MGDLLYNLTEWLRTTQLVELALWISETGASAWIVEHFWGHCQKDGAGASGAG